MPTGEERKLVTILFADLVGSTARASGEDPERVRARLDRFHAAMAAEVERTGGTLEKFAGDAVMAVFGAPRALEDHAERALHAALAMQGRLAGLFGGELAMRVGVNTGEVVVGAGRAGGSFVAGDAVNVADRLQKAAAPGEVLAGERTVAAAAGAFEFGVARVAEAKGKEAGVACRPALRALRRMRPRGAGLPRVFVGREHELDLLVATYRRAAAGPEPHLVTIVGEPGVGKTRLVRELQTRLADESAPPLVRTGRCPAYGDGITYWPLGDLLREHLGLREGHSPEEALERLSGNEILGLALGLDVARDAHPLDARERLHEAVVRFLEDLAAERPLVVLVEDVHWAEPDLLDLLERVVADARAPLLALATARPELLEKRAAWGAGRRNSTLLWLDPLPAGAAYRMLDEMLPDVLPERLRELLVERSDGNPFFIEELLGELVDVGVLERRDGDWAVRGEEATISMPDTVYAVLAARLDRLPPLEKAALQAAAVVGRVFWSSPVVALLDGEEPDFDLLEERDLIRGNPSSALADDREYVIKHALTREVAYASIPKARRGRLHAALAGWLEESALGGDERASLLAYHYSQAVTPEDADLVWADDAERLAALRATAVRWLRRAGDLARGRYEIDEAVELYERAIALCDDDHERALLWRALGEAQALRYDGEGMRTALLRALDGPLDDEERADTYAFLAFQASIRSAMWSIRLNEHLIRDWAAKALELAEKGSKAQARAVLALANVDPVDAADLLPEAAALAESLGDAGLRAYVLGAQSHTAFERHAFHEAAALSERRLELVRGIEDPDHVCEAYESGAPIVAALGRFDDARALAERHWELARRLSAHHRVHAISLHLEIGELVGDWEALASLTDRTFDLVTRNSATPCVRNPRDLLLCGAAHLVLGDEQRAAELERESARIAGEGYDTYLSAPRLRMALVRGERASADRLVRLPAERAFVWGAGVFAVRLDGLVALRLIDVIEVEASALCQEGTVVEPFALRALGFARRDDELLAKADERFAALGLEWHRAQTERLLAGL